MKKLVYSKTRLHRMVLTVFRYTRDKFIIQFLDNWNETYFAESMNSLY